LVDLVLLALATALAQPAKPAAVNPSTAHKAVVRRTRIAVAARDRSLLVFLPYIPSTSR
jgi:hypothetical protein